MTYDFSTTIEINVEDLIDDMMPYERRKMFDVLRKKLGKDADMELDAKECDARDDDPRERAIDFFRDLDLYGQRSFLVDALYVPSAVMEDALRKELEPIITAR